MKKFIINSNDSDQRIDKFIQKALPDLPKSMLYKLIRKKEIKINGKRCEISTKLNVEDIVTVYVKDVFTNSKTDLSFLNAPDKLDVIYEDDNLIIVNKPVMLEVHCSNEHSDDTLINRIKHYLYNTGSYVPDSENSFSPALCSRLDKNTCGLVTAAKNAASLREMNQVIRDGNIQKLYHCVTVGVPTKKQDILTAYHYKEESGNIVKISDNPIDDYKKIKTGYKVIKENRQLALLEVELFTGRTHQIRAHLSHIGIPVLGDGKYGNIPTNKRYGIFMQALCAYSLRFNFNESSHLRYMNGKTINSPAPEFEKLVK